VAVLLATAPVANSQMYRWTDANGTVMFSDKPPPAADVAKDLTVVLDAPGTISSPEKRGAATAEPQRSPRVTVNHAAPPPAEAPRGATADVLETFNRAAPAPASEPAAPPPRASVSPNAPEAVRDPCLRSADPKCYERNRNAYVPYLGYSPSAARDAAVGATSNAGAGGTLAGGSPAPGPGKITPPKSSVYALPPGSEPAPAPQPGTKR
jgi:hypothetical protein